MTEIPTLTPSELTRIITSAGEDDHVDAKAGVAWDGSNASASLAKDVAAFANSRDGGYIVLGKEEPSPGQFTLVGVSEDDAATQSNETDGDG